MWLSYYLILTSIISPIVGFISSISDLTITFSNSAGIWDFGSITNAVKSLYLSWIAGCVGFSWPETPDVSVRPLWWIEVEVSLEPDELLSGKKEKYIFNKVINLK